MWWNRNKHVHTWGPWIDLVEQKPDGTSYNHPVLQMRRCKEASCNFVEKRYVSAY